MEIEKKNCIDDDEIDVIVNGLNSFNVQIAEKDLKPFMIVVKENDEIVGGARCESSWNWMHVILLWIDENYRSQGLGRNLIHEIENEAKQRGCVGVYLDTLEFQALSFYQKLGYRVYGELEDHPKGYKRIYLKKRLDI